MKLEMAYGWENAVCGSCASNRLGDQQSCRNAPSRSRSSKCGVLLVVSVLLLVLCSVAAASSCTIPTGSTLDQYCCIGTLQLSCTTSHSAFSISANGTFRELTSDARLAVIVQLPNGTQYNLSQRRNLVGRDPGDISVLWKGNNQSIVLFRNCYGNVLLNALVVQVVPSGSHLSTHLQRVCSTLIKIPSVASGGGSAPQCFSATTELPALAANKLSVTSVSHRQLDGRQDLWTVSLKFNSALTFTPASVRFNLLAASTCLFRGDGSYQRVGGNVTEVSMLDSRRVLLRVRVPRSSQPYELNLQAFARISDEAVVQFIASLVILPTSVSTYKSTMTSPPAVITSPTATTNRAISHSQSPSIPGIGFTTGGASGVDGDEAILAAVGGGAGVVGVVLLLLAIIGIIRWRPCKPGKEGRRRRKTAADAAEPVVGVRCGSSDEGSTDSGECSTDSGQMAKCTERDQRLPFDAVTVSSGLRRGVIAQERGPPGKGEGNSNADTSTV